jgi:hypothetical protein
LHQILIFFKINFYQLAFCPLAAIAIFAAISRVAFSAAADSEMLCMARGFMCCAGSPAVWPMLKRKERKI